MEELGPDILAAVGIVFGVTSLMLSGSEPPPVSENIRVLSRLDDYTRKASPVVRNTIPAFLTLPGRIRALEGEPAPDLVGPIDESASTLTVKDICEAELRKGICSPNVLLLVRQQYPGSYDEWPDGDLEKMILTQRPEHRDKLCILPAWIDATPHQIVKYEGDGQRALTNRPPVLLWTPLITAAFAIGALNAYYRLLVVQFKPSPGTPNP